MNDTCTDLKNLEAAAAWQHLTIVRLRAENERLRDALMNIVSVCETWTDNHAVSKTREIAREALAKVGEA